jgi:hypothetical protein
MKRPVQAKVHADSGYVRRGGNGRVDLLANQAIDVLLR